MKKWVVLIIACLFINILSQTNISPQFSELKGMEDQLGNTHLFYRVFTYYSNDPIYQRTNHIYHWDINTNVDTFFLYDGGLISPPMSFNDTISTVEFWNSNSSEFIYGGGRWGQYFEGNAYVRRFDGYETYFQGFAGSADYINISITNDSTLYLGGWIQPNPDPNYIELIIAKSSDGGIEWDTLSTSYRFLSLIPYRENIFFVDDLEAKLYRTTDSGNTFNLVDPEFLPYPIFFYDADEQHIYRKTNNKLIASDNLGEQFSWQTKYSSDSKIFITTDESISGTIFLADKKNIFVSTDYGANFNLYKSLDRKIVGIYKKPNSNKLYAATKYKIYEITPDTVQVIKSLPIPEDAFDWLPLNLGDMWITYHEQKDSYGDSRKYFIRSEVIGYKLFGGKVYTKELQTKTMIDSLHSSETYIKYFRVDSTNGFIYRSFFLNDSLLDFESFLMDLIAEVGDTIPFGYGAILETEEIVTLFGVSSLKRIFRTVPTWEQQFELVKGFGVVYDTVWTSINYVGRLLGCVIDGTVYGDTTTVGVEDEENPIATTFKLEQNYPNPFNPSTKIKFTIPAVETRHASSLQMVTLKVYDILGNEIATLVNEEKPAGEYEVEFNGHSVEGRNLTSGIYFYQFTAGSFIQTKKMVLIK